MKEIEIKLTAREPVRLRRRLRELGWRVRGRRKHERNFVYDRGDRSLEAAGVLLRVREVGRQSRLTVKLPSPSNHIHKVREEHEIKTSDRDSLRLILEGLDYRLAWRYEKFRTQFRKPGARGEIVYDQTPVGDFLELEGEPAWIDRTAKQLGFSKSDYITATYRELFLEYQTRHRGTGRDMVFEPDR